MDKIGKL